MKDMSATIIAMTQPINFPEMVAKTPEEFVVHIARVSSPENQKNMMTAPKLLQYLIRESHWSPFEHVSLTAEIVCPRDISRQIIRHRSFTYQEYSGRYAAMPNEYFQREARKQDTKNRQNSIEFDLKDIDDFNLNFWWNEKQEEVWKVAYDAYTRALASGIAKEQARALLPEGLAQTTLYMSGTLRSFIHYVEVRTDLASKKGAQKEHRVIAELVWAEIKQYFPIITKAVEELWTRQKTLTQANTEKQS